MGGGGSHARTPRNAPAPALSWTHPGVDEAIAQAKALIAGSRTALVVSHESPDGDAIGSSLAMGLALEAVGLSVTYFNVDPLPANLRFMDPQGRYVRTLPEEARFDLTVVLDCSERHRVGKQFPAQGWSERLLVVDHHVTFDPDFAKVFVHDALAPATAELVYRIVSALGVELTPELARALWVGIATDTGSFRYQSTSAEAMELGMRLLATQMDVWEVSSHVYESQAIERTRLLARVLDTLWVAPGGRLAVLTLTDALLEELGCDASLADGFINHARSIEGVEVAAMLTGSESRGYKVSFRSRGRVDVSALAQLLGGGGHKHAAGCFMEATAAEIRARLVALTEEL